MENNNLHWRWGFDILTNRRNVSTIQVVDRLGTDVGKIYEVYQRHGRSSYGREVSDVNGQIKDRIYIHRYHGPPPRVDKYEWNEELGTYEKVNKFSSL